MTAIDINCDLGEGYGEYRFADDAGIMPYISSANIACGFHAGDAALMEASVALAVTHGVAIGAHPGLPDLQGFGRRGMSITPAEVYQIILYQLGALSAFTRAAGTGIHHLKPHGALYHMATVNRSIADAIVQAVNDFDNTVMIYGPPYSQLIEAAGTRGLGIAREAFADRRYLADGSLMPRSDSIAVITDAALVMQQVRNIITKNEVITGDGEVVTLHADTICIHSDTPGAAHLAKQIHAGLTVQNILIKSPAVHED